MSSQAQQLSKLGMTITNFAKTATQSSKQVSKILSEQIFKPAQGIRLSDKYDKRIVNDIYQSSLVKQKGISLKYMLEFGQGQLEKQLLSAQFLQQELPIRLAHRVAELENLPYGLSSVNQIITVRDWYVDSFKDIKTFPKIQNTAQEVEFNHVLQNVYRRHNPVLITMAKGIAQFRKDLNLENLDDIPQLHQFLDGFYLSRIGIRMLIGQHIQLHEPQQENFIGLICTKTQPVQIAQEAVMDARDVCMQQYGEAPEVQIYGQGELDFPYLPSHLHQMLFELVKNSLRAVHDRYEYSTGPIPPVRVIIAKGVEDITIKISDEGGGIPRSGINRIFTYLYTTAKVPNYQLTQDDEIQHRLEQDQSLLAGYGFGLPISRLLARYFGGDLSVISMEGYGTDAYLHLNRLGTSQEPLP